MSTLLFFSFYNEEYYFLSLLTMYFFMLPKIFANITRNTRTLDMQFMLLRGVNINLDPTPFLEKIRIFRSLRAVVVFYMAAILIVNSLRIVQWWNLNPFENMGIEVVTFSVVWVVCFLLRPRRYVVYSPDDFPVIEFPDFDDGYELDEVGLPAYDLSGTVAVQWPTENVEERPGTVPLSVCVSENTEDEILASQTVKQAKDV
eukprot:TRINITY_DN3300_c0_g1_i1.p1 TRINITY_DN3300_c0_g1~~TRINITY_DN3300_c0_g1_i1.p1  ORF type:complete len:230 (-),score=36.55 TRINITY_DN3300_c0_g1_i1:48-653(-)